MTQPVGVVVLGKKKKARASELPALEKKQNAERSPPQAVPSQSGGVY
jgi:hypothetical protein